MSRPRFCILYLALGGGLLWGQGYQGEITSARCGGLSGWALQGTNTVTVDLYDGSVFVLSKVASAYTVSNGYHGFSISLPSSIMDNQIHTLSARYDGTLSNLPYGNTTQYSVDVQCTPSATGYQYYFTDNLQTINTTNWTRMAYLRA